MFNNTMTHYLEMIYEADHRVNTLLPVPVTAASTPRGILSFFKKNAKTIFCSLALFWWLMSFITSTAGLEPSYQSKWLVAGWFGSVIGFHFTVWPLFVSKKFDHSFRLMLRGPYALLVSTAALLILVIVGIGGWSAFINDVSHGSFSLPMDGPKFRFGATALLGIVHSWTYHNTPTSTARPEQQNT